MTAPSSWRCWGCRRPVEPTKTCGCGWTVAETVKEPEEGQ